MKQMKEYIEYKLLLYEPYYTLWLEQYWLAR